MKKNKEYADLEKFTEINLNRIKKKKASISINSSKRITLNFEFYNSAIDQLQNSTYVELFYSKSKNIIVFNFIKDNKNKCGLKLTNLRSPKKNIYICAVAFFNFYNINLSKAKGKYEPELKSIPTLGNKWTIKINQ